MQELTTLEEWDKYRKEHSEIHDINTYEWWLEVELNKARTALKLAEGQKPPTNIGSPKCPECGGLRVVPKGDVCEGFGTLRAGA
jgi:hypothetical protein